MVRKLFVFFVLSNSSSFFSKGELNINGILIRFVRLPILIFDKALNRVVGFRVRV